MTVDTLSSCIVTVFEADEAEKQSCCYAAGSHTHSHTRTVTRTHAHTHAHTHARTHACTHARTHAHTHTHRWGKWVLVSGGVTYCDKRKVFNFDWTDERDEQCHKQQGKEFQMWSPLKQQWHVANKLGFFLIASFTINNAINVCHEAITFICWTKKADKKVYQFNMISHGNRYVSPSSGFLPTDVMHTLWLIAREFHAKREGHPHDHRTTRVCGDASMFH